jgi:hypothetical protein
MYWLEWADDSGNPDCNVFADFDDAEGLGLGVNALISHMGDDAVNEVLSQVGGDINGAVASLRQGEDVELSLPNGRLYFGVARG